MTPAILALLLFLVLLSLGVFGRALRRYLRLRCRRFGPGGFEALAREEIPAEERHLLDDAAPALAELGFVYAGSRRIQPFERTGSSAYRFADHYFHPDSWTHALVEPSDAPEPGAPWAVSFQTHYRDGTTLVTLNCALGRLLPFPPGLLVADGYLPTLADHWQFHRQRLAKAQGEVAEIRETDQRDLADCREFMEHLQRMEVLQPAADGLWRLTRGAAWGLLYRRRLGDYRLAMREPPKDAAGEALLRADLLAFRRRRSEEAGLPGCRDRLTLFGLGLVVGGLPLALFTGWQIAAIILGILLFHELGHALAMRLTGHRDIRILMLPFIGGAAMGRKEDAGPWTRMFVLLAGPVPGLLLGVFCLFLGTEGGAAYLWLSVLGIGALLINLFNLLPFLPLDGGQIVETFLFSPTPRLRVLFGLGSAGALGAIGLLAESPEPLAIAVLLLLGTLIWWKRFRLADRLGALAVESAPEAIAAALHRHPPHARMGFEERRQWTEALLPLVSARPPRLWESALGMLVYALAIVLPLLALQGSMQPHPQLRSLLTSLAGERSAKPTLDEVLARTPMPEIRWSRLMDAAASLELRGDKEGTRKRYRQAVEAAEASRDGQTMALSAKIALARTYEAEEALSRLEELLPELRTLKGQDRHFLADGLEAMHGVDDRSPTEARIARLREAVEVRGEMGPQYVWYLNEDRIKIAALLYRTGDLPGAEAELRQDFAFAAKPETGLHRFDALVWFLLDRGRIAEAEALVERQAQALPPAERTLVRQREAWVRLAGGDREGGRRELAALLGSSPAISDFDKAPLMLDLIHFSTDPAAGAALEARAKEEITASPHRDRIIRFILDQAGKEPWAGPRNEARAAGLGRLGLLPKPAATADRPPVPKPE